MAELTPEQEKAKELITSMFAPAKSNDLSFQIDLKSVFVVLAAAAMCSNPEYTHSDIRQKAFALANLLFKPDGTLND
jgi:hypothetical protein